MLTDRQIHIKYSILCCWDINYLMNDSKMGKCFNSSISGTVNNEQQTEVFSLSVLTAIFQWIWVNRYQIVSILDFIGAKDDGGGSDNWIYKLQSNCHHQQTNTQLFSVWMPFRSPNQQCQSTEGKGIVLHGLDHP